MAVMQLGVVHSSRKENERRVPLDPDHFGLIPDEICRSIFFEAGYGLPYGISDAELGDRFGGVRSREAIVGECEIVLLPKPLVQDLREMREGAVLWGWPHCVQQNEITQTAIDRRLTLLAWEAMFIWKQGVPVMHAFYRNNEMAGYCGVLHALGLTGIDGNYGARRKAVVLSLGSVSRGAVYALQGRGIEEITVYTQRPPWTVHDQVLDCRVAQMVREGDGVVVIEEDGRRRPMLEALAEADLIVNGILQDTDNPLMFLRAGDEQRLKQGSVIIDVSCDLKIGFPFARPTSFEAPTFKAGPLTYYAVDHTPTYAWRSASWEISRVIVAFIAQVMAGPDAWGADETLRRAIEIREGTIFNEKILSFQNRGPHYPHALNVQ